MNDIKIQWGIKFPSGRVTWQNGDLVPLSKEEAQEFLDDYEHPVKLVKRTRTIEYSEWENAPETEYEYHNEYSNKWGPVCQSVLNNNTWIVEALKTAQTVRAIYGNHYNEYRKSL